MFRDYEFQTELTGHLAEWAVSPDMYHFISKLQLLDILVPNPCFKNLIMLAIWEEQS